MIPALTLALLLAGRQAPQQGLATFAITPSYTDAAITQFDEPHWIYVNRAILFAKDIALPADRHQLLLWLTGTGGKGHDAQAFLRLAANLGYHAVNLMYPDEIPASVCDTDPDPMAFERFRMAIIEGGQASYNRDKNMISVPRAESIENRLIKLLIHLQKIRPREQWSQFLQQDGSIAWDRIAVAGQSQGGGHAALIGIKHPVARVICFGAPKDYSTRLRQPAAWYGDPPATPRNRFFAFNHVQDPMGCTPEALWSNLQAVEGDAFGKPAQVDEEEFPFRHQRVLYTAFPRVTVTGSNSEGAFVAHTAGINGLYADRWISVWTYLLTEETG